MPPSQQPLHHPGVTFPSWRAVIAWPDLDPSGKHQGLPESSSTTLAAKGVRTKTNRLKFGVVTVVVHIGLREPIITFSETLRGASLVVQWLGIRLPMQGTRVRALVREDPTCLGATKPVRHNY
ncbi:hypothetical protein J1605_002883 [Eschrichtius robustus]|uniref:Uncharacterized protein n=1 Tax=Eschrichtius robustus TaxID=9764 RepID=A0AB34HXV8_ESCRO|nr:hypothetical protein J1605_002883 [Eschrichtius robustus]